MNSNSSHSAPTVIQFFKERKIPLSNVWVQSCIDWIKENESYSSERELCSKVYEQWLLMDLRDVEVPQIPVNITSEKKATLQDELSLQMLSVIDISKSKYSQLQKIRQPNSLTKDYFQDKENNEYTNTSDNRVLELTLTDGVREIKAIEYRKIPLLNINLEPGIKIRIMTPVTVRRGLIMLEAHNVKILGGEVEEILVSNCFENVLAQSLGLPINPEPKKMKGIDSNITASNELPETVVEMFNVPMMSNDQTLAQNTNLIKKSMGSSGFEQKNYTAPAQKLDTFMQNSCTTERINTPKWSDIDYKHSKENVFNTTTRTENHSTKDILDSDDDLFMNIDIDQHLERVKRNENVSGAAGRQERSPITLEKVSQLVSEKKYGTYVISATYHEILQKLTVYEGAWIFIMSVKDPSGELIVRIRDSLISELTGFTCSEMLALKETCKGTDAQGMKVILNGLQRFKDKVVALDGAVEIVITEDAELPVITKFL